MFGGTSVIIIDTIATTMEEEVISQGLGLMFEVVFEKLAAHPRGSDLASLVSG